MFNHCGTEHIQNLINEGISNGTRTAVITGNWEIESAVLIPSDFTLVLDSCHLRMKDGTFDNMFRNENCGDVLARTKGQGDKNIKVIGKGEAILDGGTYNGLSEKNAGKDGRPNMFVNILLLFTHTDGFEVRNLHCRNHRYWALCFAYCSQGHISDIDFLSNDTAIDKDGNEYHCLDRNRYEDVLVKNADGIDLRAGCHDIVIENITGFVEDDSVALNAIRGTKPVAFYDENKPIDICNVKIRNIHTAAYCSNVRILSQGGIPVHDIEIENVYDTSAECEHMNIGRFGVRIGDGLKLYGMRHATEDEVYNISVRNVHSRALQGAIHLGGKMKDVTVEGIVAFDGAIEIDDKRITE